VVEKRDKERKKVEKKEKREKEKKVNVRKINCKRTWHNREKSWKTRKDLNTTNQTTQKRGKDNIQENTEKDNTIVKNKRNG
jgi:hypothetical protein